MPMGRIVARLEPAAPCARPTARTVPTVYISCTRVRVYRRVYDGARQFASSLRLLRRLMNGSLPRARCRCRQVHVHTLVYSKLPPAPSRVDTPTLWRVSLDYTRPHTGGDRGGDGTCPLPGAVPPVARRVRRAGGRIGIHSHFATRQDRGRRSARARARAPQAKHTEPVSATDGVDRHTSHTAKCW